MSHTNNIPRATSGLLFSDHLQYIHTQVFHLDPVQHVGPFVVLMEANSLVSHWNRLHSRVYCRRPRVQVENVNMNQADQVTCLLTRNVNSSLTLMFNKFFRKVSAAQQFTVSDTRCTNIADE